MSIPGLFFDIQAQKHTLEGIEQSLNKSFKRYGMNTTDKYTRMASDSNDSAVYHIPDRGRSGDMVSPEMATGNNGTGHPNRTTEER